MFREMRRKRQQTTEEEARRILIEGTSGVLALSGDDGYNYAVPISYALDGDKIYFHSAPTGHKIDSIRRNDRASFCVIGQDQILPEKFTTCFKSAIAFGRLRIVENDDDPEKRRGLDLLADKYSPLIDIAEREKEMSKMRACVVLVLDIEHLTGKVAKELVAAH